MSTASGATASSPVVTASSTVVTASSPISTAVSVPREAMYTIQRNIEKTITDARESMVKDIATAKASIDKTQTNLNTALQTLDTELASLKRHAPPPASGLAVSGPVKAAKRFWLFGGRRRSRRASRKVSRKTSRKGRKGTRRH
jgi:hypothetical protein